MELVSSVRWLTSGKRSYRERSTLSVSPIIKLLRIRNINNICITYNIRGFCEYKNKNAFIAFLRIINLIRYILLYSLYSYNFTKIQDFKLITDITNKSLRISRKRRKKNKNFFPFLGIPRNGLWINKN